MEQLKEIELPSGAILRMNPAPFADAKRLYQAILAEANLIELQNGKEYMELIKQTICVGFSSPAIENALGACLKRCSYITPDGTLHQVVNDTFEPVERREDYIFLQAAVAKENLAPFFKTLFAQFEKGMKVIEDFRKSRSPSPIS